MLYLAELKKIADFGVERTRQEDGKPCPWSIKSPISMPYYGSKSMPWRGIKS